MHHGEHELLRGEVSSPIGPLRLVWRGSTLCVLDFEDGRASRLVAHHHGARLSGLLERRPPRALSEALVAYFDGELGALSRIQVWRGGTAFERETWDALGAIAPGTTCSYGELARRLGRASSSRAIGRANGANPIGLVVPCHRVIGASGALTGYAGGLERKAWLLAHEARAVAAQRIKVA